MALEGSERPGGLQRTGAGKLDRRFFTAAHCGIYFALGLTMACARVMDAGAPFGVALVAAAGPGLSGVSALLGASLGYLGASGLEWGIRYAAASVLVYTVAFVFHELPVSRQSLTPRSTDSMRGLGSMPPHSNTVKPSSLKISITVS